MTNKPQNLRIRKLADELHRLHALGAPVNPEMLRLASWLMRPDRRVKLNESPIQGPILRALAAPDAPRLGYLCGELIARTGLTKAQVNVCLRYMHTIGMVARFEAPRRCRYFRTAAALEAVRDELLKLEEARKVVKPVKLPKDPKPPKPPKEPKAPKPPREPRPEKLPKPPMAPRTTKPHAVKESSRKHFNAPITPKQQHLPRVAGLPRPPAPSLPPLVLPPPPPPRRSIFESKPEPVVPPHVQVQQLPSGRDTRFTVTGPIVGGFLDEWREKRKKGN